MKPFLPVLAVALVLCPALGACRSQPRPETAALPAPAFVLPQSSLTALVRLLETVDALRPAEGALQIRAVECDSLLEHAPPAEFVRVFLHISAFAPDVARARAAYEELRAALEAEAHAPQRTEWISAERAAHAFALASWNPPAADNPSSYSDALRLEVAPGRATPELEDGEARDAAASLSAERYVQTLAQEFALPVRARELGVRSLASNLRDLRCELVPADPDGRHTPAEIGAFLCALETRSPAARLTHVRIERASQLADVLGPDAWTFQAQLTVRTSAP